MRSEAARRKSLNASASSPTSAKRSRHPALRTEGFGENGPDPRPLLLLHRADDSFTVIARKVGKSMEQGGAFRVRDIESVFPGLREWLWQDSYWLLNGVDGARHYGVNQETGLHLVRRTLHDLKWLNVGFVDLDCYKVGIKPGAAVGDVLDLQDEHVIPAPSFFIRSRGVWCGYVLHEEGTNLPPRATAGNVALYRKIQNALCEKLAHLGADRQATDAVRLARVCGGLNTKAEPGTQPVHYIAQGTDQGIVSYTMAELVTRLNVERTESRVYTSWAAPVERRTAPAEPQQDTSTAARGAVKGCAQRARGVLGVGQAPVRGAQGNKGWLARWQYVLDDLARLEDLRGGFRDGTRHNAIFVLVAAGSKILDRCHLEQEVRALAKRCRPLLPEHEALAYFRRLLKWPASGRARWVGKRPPCISYPTCARLLKVTKEEEALLVHWFRPPKVDPRKLRRQCLDDAIHEIVRERGGLVPQPADMVGLLVPRGISVSRRTVGRDYRRLGLAPDQSLLLDINPHLKPHPPSTARSFAQEIGQSASKGNVRARMAAIRGIVANMTAKGERVSVRKVERELARRHPELACGRDRVHFVLRELCPSLPPQQQGMFGLKPKLSRRRFGVRRTAPLEQMALTAG